MSLMSLFYHIRKNASYSGTKVEESCESYYVLSHCVLGNDQLFCNECESAITVLNKI